jgi:tetratricopeptide (TPR) repeat protein
MKFIILTATLALAAAGTPAIAQTQQAPATQTTGGLVTHQAKLSSAAGKAIMDLQTAVTSHDTASIPAKLAAANAVAKTGDDRYAIGLLELKAATAAKDGPGMAAAIEQMLNSGTMNADEQKGFYDALAQVYGDLKQPAKMADALQHVLTLDPNNVDAIANLAEAKVQAGAPEAGLALLQKGIAMQSSGGRKAPEAWYKRAVAIAYNAKLPAASTLASEWVAAYPSPASWHDAVAIYRNLNSTDSQGILDLYRLESAVGALQKGEEYAAYAVAAADQMNFNEAQAVMDAGAAAHAVDPASADYREIFAALKTKSKATAADLDAALKMSPNPTNVLRIGDRFYAMGDYAKAADVYRKLLATPGADKDLANLHLGMALARAGDKAAATAALNGVTGSHSAIAKFWLLYVQQHA